MLSYLRQFRTYNKEEVHNHRVFVQQEVPQHIIPIEQICHLCKTQLSNPITVTNNAKVVTLQGVFHNFKSFVKKCFQCGHFYRYQESNHRILNYDDRFFIGIDICIYLQQHLQHHSSIASFVNAYNTMFDEKLQNHKVMYAYLTFDVLKSNTVDFFCRLCGYQPWALVMNLNKKIAFKCSTNKLEYTSDAGEEDIYGDTVNVALFWEKVEKKNVVACISRSCHMRAKS